MTETNGYKRYFFWLALFLLFFIFIYLIRGVLLPFVLGAAIAYFLDPAADRLEKWKLSRSLATAVIMLLFFAVLTLFVLLVIPTLSEQFSGLLADMPAYLTQFEARYEAKVTHYLGALPGNYMGGLKDAASNISGAVLGMAGGVAAGIFHSGMAIVNFLSLILLTPVVAFYLLRDWDRIVAKLHSFLPRQHEKTIREQLALIDQTLSGFIRGQMNVCAMLGAFYALGLSMIGLKFGILIGLLTGFLTIIPYAGLAFGMVLGLGVALFQFDDMSQVGAVLAVFVVGQIIEGNFITPKLVGEKVGLHPVWIIFGMLVGAALFGFVGVLIAVPSAAVLGVLIRFSLGQYLQSSYYHGKRAKK